MVLHDFWQTGFVDETTAVRVERIKQEKGSFWEPFAKVTQEETKMSSLQVWTALQCGPSFNKKFALLLIKVEQKLAWFFASYRIDL